MSSVVLSAIRTVHYVRKLKSTSLSTMVLHYVTPEDTIKRESWLNHILRGWLDLRVLFPRI